MLQPRRVKYRKQHRGRMRGIATRNNEVAFGEYGLQSQDPGWVTARQIEAARIAMTRYIRRGGKVWIKIFPHKPVTKKPAEVRMGGGKGAPEFWVAVVKPGTVMFELAGVPEATAREALRLAAHKLPVRTKIVKRKLTAAEAKELAQVVEAAQAAAEAAAEAAQDAEDAADAQEVQDVQGGDSHEG